MVTITDTITGTTATVESWDVAETIAAMNADAPADAIEEITEAAAQLQRNLAAGQPYGDQEEFLAVRVSQ